MIRRIAPAGILLVGVMAWGGVVPASADLGLFAPAAQACIAELPCDALFAVGLAAAGVVYLGSSDQQKAALGQLLDNGVTALSNTALGDQCAGNGGSDCSLTLGQAINSMGQAFQNAISSGQQAAPLTTGQGAALQALGHYLVANPLPGVPGWGLSGNVQSFTQSNPCCGWTNGIEHAVPINLAPYAAAVQVIAYQEVSITFPANGTFTFCIWNCAPLIEYSIGGDGSGACCPTQGNNQPMIRWWVDGVVRGSRTNGNDGSIGQLSGSGTRWFDGQSEASLAGTTHTLKVAIYNEAFGGGSDFSPTNPTAATGIMEPAGAQIYNGANGGSGLVLDGANWQIGTTAATMAVPALGVAPTMPKTIPVTGGQVFGAPLAGVGSVVGNPAATLTNVGGIAVPVAGAGATTTAGSFAGTLTGVADGIASMANTVSRAFDFSRPIKTDKLKIPAAAFSTRFPFSIPFDVVNIAHGVLGNITPTAPNIGINIGSCGGHFSTSCAGQGHTLDLSVITPFMPWLRWVELAGIMLGVLLVYRRMVGGAV